MIIKKVLKNKFFFKKNIFLFFNFSSFFILTLSLILKYEYIYAVEDDMSLFPLIGQEQTSNIGNNIQDVLFNENNEDFLVECPYQLNKDLKHNFLFWKHDLGSVFSKKVNAFYGIKNVKLLPCYSTKEWLNLKQLFFALINYHIPKMDFFFDMVHFSGFKEEFIDNKYDRVSMDTTHFCYLLKKNPSLGCFYFKSKDLDYVKSFNISFCNCKVSGYSLLELILEISSINSKDKNTFLKHLFDYLNYLNEEFKSSSLSLKNSKKINMSVEQLLDKISENSDIDILDRDLLFHLIKNLIYNFLPKNFLIDLSVDNNDIKKKPLKEYKFELRSEIDHKTIGFLLQVKKQDDDNQLYIYFYEIFNNEEDIEKLNLIQKILISSKDLNNSIFLNHLLISVTKLKKYVLKDIFLFGADKK
ncbi:hypothetical protein [Candidatus Phytoplasma oryzae]|nr:hypothetical protein PIE28_00335 [Candidatus Phytoplasma oryzae]